MGKKGKTEVGTEVGKGVKKKPHKYGYICVGFCFESFSTCPRSATSKFTVKIQRLTRLLDLRSLTSFSAEETTC